VATKGNENAIKNGGMTFRITSTQYGWKKIASITQLNPLKFKTWKLQEKTLSRVTSIHNLNITGEEMTLWKKEIPIFKMLFLILLETKESLLKQESI
jgi:hypothetical protein